MDFMLGDITEADISDFAAGRLDAVDDQRLTAAAALDPAVRQAVEDARDVVFGVRRKFDRAPRRWCSDLDRRDTCNQRQVAGL